MNRPWDIIGVGCGWGARNRGTAEGAQVLMANMPNPFQNFSKSYWDWHGKENKDVLHPYPLTAGLAKTHRQHILAMALFLSNVVRESRQKGKLPLVLGGDHSTAIGTWAGIKATLDQEEMGLVWIDAHMDAHTPQTSHSLNIHGMPVAILLGHGDGELTNLQNQFPKVKPENLFLIGVRSFEPEEAAFLSGLGVRIYTMEEVRPRSFDTIFNEVRNRLKGIKFGLSIDVDAFDPMQAPGTGTLEPDGLYWEEVASSLQGLARHSDFLALEIAEFNPFKDIDTRTCRLVWDIIACVTGKEP